MNTQESIKGDRVQIGRRCGSNTKFAAHVYGKRFQLGGKNLWTHKTLKNSHYFIFFSDCTVYIKYFIQYSE